MHIMIYNAFYQCSVISPWEKKKNVFSLFQRRLCRSSDCSFVQKYASSVNKDITLCYDMPR